MLWAVATLQLSLSDATLRRLDTVVAQHMLRQLQSLPPGLGQPAANFLWGLSQLRLSPLDGRYAAALTAVPLQCACSSRCPSRLRAS